jgi:hypothetical protein
MRGSSGERARSTGTLAIPKHLFSATLSSGIPSSAENTSTRIDRELQPHNTSTLDLFFKLLKSLHSALNEDQGIYNNGPIAFEFHWMYWLTGSAPAKSAIALPVIKITLHPRPGFKLYTDAEKSLCLFITPIQATSILHKDLFVTNLILPELNLIIQTHQKPTHFAPFDCF